MSLDKQSRNRRKPLRTYKSPSADELIIIPQVVESSTSSSSSKGKATKLGRSLARNIEGFTKDNATRSARITIRCACPKSPPLPLFHPLGKLAMSLPPLDPTIYGLPVLAVPDELSEDLQNGRTKNGAKIVEDDGESVGQGVSAVAAMAARERASPRKRRTGGGSKRKRKDGDDGDASYPAKKTRIPRGQNVGEEETQTGVDNASNIEMGGDELVEKRRSSRTKGASMPASKRRDSTDSGTTTDHGHDKM